MRPQRRALTLVLAILAGTAASSQPVAYAQGETCAPRTVTTTAVADAWVDENGVDANKGSDALLQVAAQMPANDTRSLVRFPAVGAAPAGCVVESARLRLYADSGSAGSKVEALRLAAAWTEGSVTWSNQPATAGAGVLAWSMDGYMQWNVTPLVAAGVDQGFLLRDPSEDLEEGGAGHGFYAREKGENPPQLVIRYAAPPSGEPAPPAPPAPATVRCGDVLTESTLVVNDLSECLGDGLVIGAPRIIVDLGGHTIDGTGLGTGVRNDGYESVQVRNGTVRDFDRGVYLLPETRGNVLERLRLEHNEVGGIELFDATDNEIRDSVLDDNGDAIALVSGTARTLVADNVMTLNRGAGLLLQDSDDNRLERNTVSGGGDLGVGLEHSSGNVLLDNRISGNSDGGMEIELGSNDNLVEGNVLSESGDTGILVSFSDRNRVVGNTTRLMSDSGITLDAANDGLVMANIVGSNPGGLQMDGSSRNRVEANDASGTTGIGIELGGGSYDNDLVGNRAGGNAAQGIYIADEALLEPGNRIVGNTADGNGADGIALAKGGHTLTANVTRGNRGWGINAGLLNTDGGRNVASGNGEPGQCLGVVCVAVAPPPPDQTAPDTFLAGTPDIGDGTATLAFGGTDDRATETELRFECRLDDGPWLACVSPVTYNNLGAGAHRFEVRAIDLAGNADATPATFGWTEEPPDTTAPETSIDSGPSGETVARSASFEFSADEARATFECSLDGAAFAACASPLELTDLTLGAHELRVRAIDAAGNVDPSPTSRAWTVVEASDTAVPETSIESGPSGETTSSTARFEFSADEAGATFECSLDGAVFGPCATGVEYSLLGLGAHSLDVRAIDAAGNVDASPASRSWTIVEPPDTTAPETSIDLGPSGETTSTSARFEFSADEAGATFECSLDGAVFASCESGVEYRGLSLGLRSFEVRATDAAGNVDGTPARRDWTVVVPPDTTAPETSIDSGPSGETTSTSARFEFSADDAGATFECSLDGAAFAACASPLELTDLTLGAHELRVRAIDAAGNVDPSPASRSWTIVEPPDTMAPETTIDAGPSGETTSTSARFEFSADEAGATFECSLDGAAFGPCATGVEYSLLGLGAHELRVRAIDAAGNVDGTPARRDWTIVEPPDTRAPETSIDAGPERSTESTDARFEFSSDEGGSSFECALDGGGFGPCESPLELTGLSPGAHVMQVRAVDAAGNRDAAPDAYEWTVLVPRDTRAPETTIVSGPSGETVNTAARLEFSADEADATFECSLDGAPFAGCASPLDLEGLTVGSHELRVRAIDAAGNVDGTSASRSWTVLAPPPPCTPRTVILTAAADTWVLQSSPRKNYGNDGDLKVDSKPRDNARALVRFELPSIPAGCRVQSAALSLYATSYKTGRTLEALPLGSAWAERQVTWATQPAPVGAAATVAAGPGYREWTVTAQVEAMYASANHGFLIRDAAESSRGFEQVFQSREKDDERSPRLVVTFGSP